MATTVSTVNQSLVDERVVEALRLVLPMLRAFSFGVSAEEKIQNDVVYVPIATDPSTAAKTAGTFATGTGTLAGSAVTLSTFRAAAWDFSEGAVPARLFEQAWADKVAGGVYVLAKYVIDLGLALVTAANYNDTTADKLVVAPADFGPNDLGQLWTKGVEKIKQRQRSVFLNAEYAGALLGESTLATVFSMAGNNFMASGVIPQLLGMPTFVYPDLPSNNQNLGGMVVGAAAIGIAAAPPSQLLASGMGDVVERRIITEPDSGLSLQYTMKAGAGGTISGEVAVLAGVAKLQDAIVRLVSA
jgi:hypothetical protein